MLSTQELSTLFQIISDDNQTFETIFDSFNKSFDKSNQFKVGASLCILLKDNLLNITQKIISYYILYTFTTEDKIINNPFLPIILEIVKNTKNKIEQNFLTDFLYNQINYIKSSVKSYIQENSNESKLNLNEIQIFSEQYNKSKTNILSSLNDHMRDVIYDRKNNDIKNLDKRNTKLDNNNIIEDLNLNYFQPNYMSYYTSQNSLFKNEPIWITPTLKHDYIWEKIEK